MLRSFLLNLINLFITEKKEPLSMDKEILLHDINFILLHLKYSKIASSSSSSSRFIPGAVPRELERDFSFFCHSSAIVSR